MDQYESEIRKLKAQIQILTTLNENLSIEVAESQQTRDSTSHEFTKMFATIQKVHSFLDDDDEKNNLFDEDNNESFYFLEKTD